MTYWFPAVLSFFVPGLGQIVKGDFVKGLSILISMAACWFVFLEFILLLNAIILSIIIFLALTSYWIWNVYDAYTAYVNA